MRLAVIPARGGSKRIPRKNIKPFCGQPMIAWSIQAAIDSECFDRIIVSTDDLEVAEVARSFGAEVPFMRPVELADDYVGTTPVVAHAIRWQASLGCPAQEVCCIYATAPFVRPSDLRNGLRVLLETSAEYAFSVTSFAFPIQRAVRINSSQRVAMFDPESFNIRSQDLEEAWHDAGQFYWGNAEAWLQGKPIFSEEAAAVRLPRFRVQDIDTHEDWEHAEWLFRAIQSRSINEAK